MDKELVWRGIIVLILGIALLFSPSLFGFQLTEWIGYILILLGLIGIVIGVVRKTS